MIQYKDNIKSFIFTSKSTFEASFKWNCKKGRVAYKDALIKLMMDGTITLDNSTFSII